MSANRYKFRVEFWHGRTLTDLDVFDEAIDKAYAVALKLIQARWPGEPVEIMSISRV